MVNKIIDGISIKLNQTFGDKYNIYTETVKQGFKEPCFFIMVLNSEETPMMGTRYFREYSLDIHYFPRNRNDKNDEIIEVAEKLFDALEYVTIDNGNKIRGLKRNYEIVDDVLHFFITYKVFIRKIDTLTDNMENLQVKNSVKG